jgi:hypothetical protein
VFYGISQEGTPAAYLTKAENVDYTSEGRIRKRPARNPITNFSSRVTPAWIGTNGTLVYDADSTDLRQAATSVFAGFTAANIASAVYTDAAGTVYLLVCDTSANAKKITGTTDTDITGLPATNPRCFGVAGRRVFVSQSNTVAWSTFSPTLGLATEWPSDNEITIADKGIQTVLALVELNGYMYAFGSGAVAQLDPRDPLNSNDIVLTGFGIQSNRQVVAGKSSIYFSNGFDVFEWVPGQLPRSIAILEDGRSLIRGALIDAQTASNPFDAMGYDPLRDLLVISNNTETYAYNVQLQAWAKWNFPADAWTFAGSTLYFTYNTLVNSYKIDYTKAYDTINATDTQFTWTVQTASFKADQESQICIKKVRVGYPSDTALASGTVTVSVVGDGGDVLSTDTATLDPGNVIIFDTSTFGGSSVFGGSGNEGWDWCSYPYPQRNIVGFRVVGSTNSAQTLYSLLAQYEQRHVHPGGM